MSHRFYTHVIPWRFAPSTPSIQNNKTMNIYDDLIFLLDADEQHCHLGDRIAKSHIERDDIIRLLCQFESLETRIGKLAVDYFKVTEPEEYENTESYFGHGEWFDKDWSMVRIKSVDAEKTTVLLSRDSIDYDSDYHRERTQYREFSFPTDIIWNPDQTEHIARAAEQKRDAELAKQKKAEEDRKKREAEAVKSREAQERKELERLSKKYGGVSSK